MAAMNRVHAAQQFGMLGGFLESIRLPCRIPFQCGALHEVSAYAVTKRASRHQTGRRHAAADAYHDALWRGGAAASYLRRCRPTFIALASIVTRRRAWPTRYRYRTGRADLRRGRHVSLSRHDHLSDYSSLYFFAAICLKQRVSCYWRSRLRSFTCGAWN